MAKTVNNSRILVFSDLHAPYQHHDAIDFLRATVRDFKPDKVVCTGDLIDGYFASAYTKDPGHGDTAGKEISKVRDTVAELAEFIPKLVITLGNHDKRIERQIMRAGLPMKVAKPLHKLFKIPAGWKVKDLQYSLTVRHPRKRIEFFHHRQANSLTVAAKSGCNVVQGHQHSKCNIQYQSNGKQVIWGVQAPTLISNTGCPFSYSKLSDINPVRGCVLIMNGNPIISTL